MKQEDYNALLQAHLKQDYNLTLTSLVLVLLESWMDDYYKMPNGETQLVEFKDEGFTFLFDMDEGSDSVFITQHNASPRDKSRMNGFVGSFGKIPRYNGYDKGHFISHKIGGMLDQNLFPHRLEPNRGYKTRNEEDAKWREMERYCEHHEGIFMFSRPIYNNPSWIPAELEIGYLSNELEFVVERVLN